ncbi:trypsin-like peptidase domain-containing protein [Fibrella sp. HMF5335]|uniref:Trypsin-like peptidase domain-containing protein n=2 Tax=Fibrella rubiginis TaxID=2817060 RepID=A0A939K7Z1_9BACT|nr:trypsin-like peptidase domain-containing protein [Fibrella rubiginis]
MNADDMNSFEDTLRAYGRRVAFKNKLDSIHQSLEADALLPVAEPHQPVRVWWNVHRPTLAIAAAVAIMTTFATIILYRSYQNSHKQDQQYGMMMRNIAVIQQTQNKLLNNISGRGRVFQQNPGQVAGSGFLLTSSGFLVTNNHIVQGSDSVYVQSQQGEVYKARIVHTDPQHDLAILAIGQDTAFHALPPVPYSFEARPSDLGERVFTLGYPREEIVYGEGYLSSGTGFRGDSAAYQVAISVNPGNSGGPLLNERGNIIGIITAKQITSEGATFAVKTNVLLNALAAISPDSLKGDMLALNRKNRMTRLSRKQQIKQMQAYVYQVKVFKH